MMHALNAAMRRRARDIGAGGRCVSKSTRPLARRVGPPVQVERPPARRAAATGVWAGDGARPTGFLMWSATGRGAIVVLLKFIARPAGSSPRLRGRGYDRDEPAGRGTERTRVS